jgi:hypothetical protein
MVYFQMVQMGDGYIHVYFTLSNNIIPIIIVFVNLADSGGGSVELLLKL